MGGNSPEQGPRLWRRPAPGQGCRGQDGGETEARQPDGMAGAMKKRAEDILGQPAKRRGRGAEHLAPSFAVPAECGGGRLDGTEQQSGTAVVEWMRTVDLRPAPLEAIFVQAEGPQRR